MRVRDGGESNREGNCAVDWMQAMLAEGEQPLDRLADGYSKTAILRTLGVIGDSLSSGEFESRDKDGKAGYHDFYEYSWGQYIARRHGLQAYNFSCGGMTAKWYMEGFADEQDWWNPGKACQAYVLALGVNDVINQGQEVGSVSDVDIGDYRRNKPTFAGYYAGIVSRLKEIQPEARFFFVTMPRAEDAKDGFRKAHAALLGSLAECFDYAYVIDLYRYAPVYDEAFRRRFYLYDHLNASGYILTARIIDSYIDFLIRRHPEDFRRVPFIGTGLR